MLSRRARWSRIYLPPDANCLLVGRRPLLPQPHYVNLIVIDKQPQLQWLDMDAAREHCARGASSLGLGRARADGEPDVVLGLRRRHPDPGDARRRLAAAPARARAARPRGERRRPHALFPPDVHPHGMTDERVRRPLHRGRRTWSSRSTATRARSTSWSTARPHPSASTCAASTRRAPRRRRSTWSC